MSGAYDDDIFARFDADWRLDDDPPDIAALHGILLRRTHRQYSPRPVSEGLVTLLTAVALSASSKSDFQQASIIRVTDPEKRAALAALIPAMPWIGAATRDGWSGSESCAGTHSPTAGSRGFSMPPSTRRWRCRHSSSLPKRRGSAAARSA